MKLTRAFGTAAAAFAFAAAAQQPLTVANFGGANGKAQEAAFLAPFSRTFGIPARGVEYTGDMAALRAMVRDRKIEWDVVEVESADLKPGCDAGLFERVDRASLSQAGMLL